MASFTPGSFDGATSGTLPVTIAGSPASGFQRLCRSFKMCNIDTAPVTFTIQYVDGANTRTLVRATLQVGDNLQMSENDMEVLDATNKFLQLFLAAPVATNELGWSLAYSDFSGT